jgi:hypothetical protein
MFSSLTLKSTDGQLAEMKVQLRLQDNRLWIFVAGAFLTVPGILAKFAFSPQARHDHRNCSAEIDLLGLATLKAEGRGKGLEPCSMIESKLFLGVTQ